MYKYQITQNQIPDKLVAQETEYIELMKLHNPNFLGLYKVDKVTSSSSEFLAYLLFDIEPTQQEIDELKTIVQNQDVLDLSIGGSLIVSASNMGDMTTPKFKMYTLDIFFYRLLKVLKPDVSLGDIKKLSVTLAGDVVVTTDTGNLDVTTLTSNRTQVLWIEFYDEVYPYKSGELMKVLNRSESEYETLVSSIFESIP
jgi:hypothetical protein